MKKILFAGLHLGLAYVSYKTAGMVWPANGFLEAWLMAFSLIHLTVSTIYILCFVNATVGKDNTKEIERMANKGESLRKCRVDYCKSKCLIGEDGCAYHNRKD